MLGRLAVDADREASGEGVQEPPDDKLRGSSVADFLLYMKITHFIRQIKQYKYDSSWLLCQKIYIFPNNFPCRFGEQA